MIGALAVFIVIPCHRPRTLTIVAVAHMITVLHVAAWSQTLTAKPAGYH